jgi:predicted RNA binding protein YcfA (HicA-like mRNA interferase family)
MMIVKIMPWWRSRFEQDSSNYRQEMIHLLERMGFYVKRKKGAHHFLYHREDPSRFALVSVHSGETIPPGTLTTSKISIDELRNQI